MLEVRGAPWLAKFGSQEKTCQDSAQSWTPSRGRALLVGRCACWRDCDTYLLSPEECPKIQMVRCPWAPQDGAISLLPIRPAKHPHSGEPAHNTYPCCVREVSCPALFGLGDIRVISKNSNLFLSEKLPTAANLHDSPARRCFAGRCVPNSWKCSVLPGQLRGMYRWPAMKTGATLLHLRVLPLPKLTAEGQYRD